jgi:hypothetical protein
MVAEWIDVFFENKYRIDFFLFTFGSVVISLRNYITLKIDLSRYIIVPMQLSQNKSGDHLHSAKHLCMLLNDTTGKEFLRIPVSGFRSFQMGGKTGSDYFEVFSVFPNPSIDRCWLHIDASLSELVNSIRIYDVSGALVSNTSSFGTGGIIELDVSALSSGMYQVQVFKDDAPLGSVRLTIQK